MKRTYTRFFTVFTGLLLALYSCDKEEFLSTDSHQKNTVRSIGDYIENNYNYSILATALEYTGLLDTLQNGKGPYTLFAIGDEGFQSVGIANSNVIRKLDRDSLRKALEYHVLRQSLRQSDIPIEDYKTKYATLLGEDVLVSRCLWYPKKGYADNTYYMTSFSGAELKKESEIYTVSASDPYFNMNVPDYPEQELSNGIVQRIDRPMRPFFDKTIQQWLEEHNEYSLFVAGLKKFSLWDKLADETAVMTVFAPTNENLVKYGMDTVFFANVEPDEYLGELLLGVYIVSGQQFLIDDFDYFYAVSAQTYYQDQPEGTNGYNRFIAGAGMSHNGKNFERNRKRGWACSLAITKQSYPWGYQQDSGEQNAELFLGMNDYSSSYSFLKGDFYTELPMGKNRIMSDNLCKNGVIHPFHAVAVLPEEAKK